MKFTDRIRDYGLTLEEDVIIHDRRVVDASADMIDELDAAMRRALNFIENTEGECGAELICGDGAREALAKLEKLNRD